MTDKLIKHTMPYFPAGRGLFFKVFGRQKKREVSFPLARQIPGKTGLFLQGNTIDQNFFPSRKSGWFVVWIAQSNPLNDWGQYVTC